MTAKSGFVPSRDEPSEPRRFVAGAAIDSDEDRWRNEGGATNDPVEAVRAIAAETARRALVEGLRSLVERRIERLTVRALELGIARSDDPR